MAWGGLWTSKIHIVSCIFLSYDINIKSYQENTYEVVIPDPLVQRSFYPAPPQRATFGVDPDSAVFCEKHGVPLPILPSRVLVAIRAICARVAQRSGVIK